jgi:hypothetical protein
LEKEEEKDSQLDDTIGQLGVAEYQVNKLRRILGSRLDRSNPIAFSKKSSIYSFESGGKEYRITIEVDTFDIRESSIPAFIDALKSPAFIITSILCSAIICVLALVNLYWSSPVLGTFSDRELGMLDRQYSMMLDRCATFINDDDNNNHDRPDPRIFGALYSICDKTVIQLQGFCKEHHIATCDDKRIELYLTGKNNKPTP